MHSIRSSGHITAGIRLIKFYLQLRSHEKSGTFHGPLTTSPLNLRRACAEGALITGRPACPAAAGTLSCGETEQRAAGLQVRCLPGRGGRLRGTAHFLLQGLCAPTVCRALSWTVAPPQGKAQGSQRGREAARQNPMFRITALMGQMPRKPSAVCCIASTLKRNGNNYRFVYDSAVGAECNRGLFLDPVASLSRLLGAGGGALSWAHAQAGRHAAAAAARLGQGRSPRGFFSWLLLASPGAEVSGESGFLPTG